MRVAAAWRETEPDLGDGEGDVSLVWPREEWVRMDDDMPILLGISRFGVDEEGEREASGFKLIFAPELDC